jgi:hypothetical protein
MRRPPNSLFNRNRRRPLDHSTNSSSMKSQLPVRDSKLAFDLRWDSSYDLTGHFDNSNQNGQFHVPLRYVGAAADDPTVKDLIGDLSVDPYLPDSRATWHRNYTPLAPWIKAHVLKLAMGWNGEKQLAEHFEKHPTLAGEYGFVSNNSTARPETMCLTPPAQSRLWKLWHEEFGDELRGICREIVKELVELAREAGIPAPDDVFQPDDEQSTSERPETRLIAERPRRSGSTPSRSSPRNSSSSAATTPKSTRTRSGNNTRSWASARTCSPRAARTVSTSTRPAPILRPSRATAGRSASCPSRKCASNTVEPVSDNIVVVDNLENSSDALVIRTSVDYSGGIGRCLTRGAFECFDLIQGQVTICHSNPIAPPPAISGGGGINRQTRELRNTMRTNRGSNPIAFDWGQHLRLRSHRPSKYARWATEDALKPTIRWSPSRPGGSR